MTGRTCQTLSPLHIFATTGHPGINTLQVERFMLLLSSILSSVPHKFQHALFQPLRKKSFSSYPVLRKGSENVVLFKKTKIKQSPIKLLKLSLILYLLRMWINFLFFFLTFLPFPKQKKKRCFGFGWSGFFCLFFIISTNQFIPAKTNSSASLTLLPYCLAFTHEYCLFQALGTSIVPRCPGVQWLLWQSNR